jgi:hypothetical protein
MEAPAVWSHVALCKLAEHARRWPDLATPQAWEDIINLIEADAISDMVYDRNVNVGVGQYLEGNGRYFSE